MWEPFEVFKVSMWEAFKALDMGAGIIKSVAQLEETLAALEGSDHCLTFASGFKSSLSL